MMRSGWCLAMESSNPLATRSQRGAVRAEPKKSSRCGAGRPAGLDHTPKISWVPKGAARFHFYPSPVVSPMGDSKKDAVCLFGALVEELCMDVCFEAHHQYYLNRYLASKGADCRMRRARVRLVQALTAHARAQGENSAMCSAASRGPRRIASNATTATGRSVSAARAHARRRAALTRNVARTGIVEQVRTTLRKMHGSRRETKVRCALPRLHVVNWLTAFAARADGNHRAKRTSSDARLSSLSASSKSYRHQSYGSK